MLNSRWCCVGRWRWDRFSTMLQSP